MLIFFVLEDPDSNDLLCKILEDAGVMYPFLDKSRVYITGHSHNGHYSFEFACRHPNLLAGIATMGNTHGLPTSDIPVDKVIFNDAQLNKIKNIDMPLVNINGQWENAYSCKQVGAMRFRSPEEKGKQFQNRLIASNCPLKQNEEILAAADSPDLATRMVGVPNDRSEVLYFEGDECYIADVINNEGRIHLRLVTLENLPHATSAHMPWLSWNFLRRFARNQETGKLVELW
jgi:hypothetical protein